MSEINANIVVQQIGANIVVEENNINITPEDIQLRIFSGGFATPSGNSFEVQFNNGGILGGNPNLKFYPSNTTTVANNITITNNLVAANSNVGEALAGNLYANAGIIGASLLRGTLVDTAQPNISSVGNLISLNVVGNINGGNANLGNAVVANYFIGNGSLLTGIDTTKISNGNSNVQVYANSNIAITVAGNANVGVFTGTGVNIAGYANITGNLNSSTLTTGNITAGNISASGDLTVANITSNGNISFTGANVSIGNSSNLKITGGLNGYFLQTDGAGNLTWAASAGNVTGNGVPGGANTQIQFNDAGNFGGAAGFTFNKSTNAMATPGNLTVSGTVIGNVRGPIVNLAYALENVALITSQAGLYNYNILGNSIKFPTTDATSNVTINFIGNGTISANTLIANGQSVTCTYVLKTGSSPYYVTNIQIDGANQTVNWLNGYSPMVFNNSYMSYTFTIVKNSTTPTYVVLGSATRYA